MGAAGRRAGSLGIGTPKARRWAIARDYRLRFMAAALLATVLFVPVLIIVNFAGLPYGDLSYFAALCIVDGIAIGMALAYLGPATD